MTTNFVLAIGRSGTLWLATALSEAAGLDARHESIAEWGGTLRFGQVEVNSHLWEDSREIWRKIPAARVCYLVRDGREVVRSILSRPRPGRTLSVVCEMWRARNHHLRREIGLGQCYRMEDVTADFTAFRRIASYLGGEPNKEAWKPLRGKRINSTDEYLLGPFREWTPEDQEIFWNICGDEMEVYGYER